MPSPHWGFSPVALSRQDVGKGKPLGWGLNPQAVWYGIALSGDAPERSRAAARTFPGNFLFSTGPNTQGGGTRNTLGHYDVPMRDCTVSLDNEVIIERGKLVDPQMRVTRVAR
jgi:2,5-dihydroxypyridine 5,6-dioxygenase